MNGIHIETLNDKFIGYEGTDVGGVRVNVLIQTVIASNNQEMNYNTHYCVEIEGIGILANGGDLLITKNNNYRLPTSYRVSSSDVFTVKLEYNELQYNKQQYHCISKIIITKNN